MAERRLGSTFSFVPGLMCAIGVASKGNGGLGLIRGYVKTRTGGGVPGATGYLRLRTSVSGNSDACNDSCDAARWKSVLQGRDGQTYLYPTVCLTLTE